MTNVPSPMTDTVLVPASIPPLTVNVAPFSMVTLTFLLTVTPLDIVVSLLMVRFSLQLTLFAACAGMPMAGSKPDGHGQREQDAQQPPHRSLIHVSFLLQIVPCMIKTADAVRKGRFL